MTPHQANPPLRRRVRTTWSQLLVLTLAGGALVGCSADSPSATTEPYVEPRLTILTAEAPIADLVRRVGGPEVAVEALVPAGADSHTWEPMMDDLRQLDTVDAYFESGMGLNNAITVFASNGLPDDVPIVFLSSIIPFDEVIPSDSAEQIAAHGHAHNFNAHFWPDPMYARLYAHLIKQTLIELDPAGADGYTARAEAFEAELAQLDVVFREVISTIPAENRKLVVYHDSWSYYGRRYDLPVVGAIQPTDFSEPSAAEVRATIDQVRAAGVPAFFGSEVFPSDVLDAIAEETDAEYVADLSDDALPGEPGEPGHSYIGMMVANTRIIVDALGGDSSALNAVDPTR